LQPSVAPYGVAQSARRAGAARSISNTDERTKENNKGKRHRKICSASPTVTARRRRHHQCRTTRVWNVLDSTAQQSFRFWIAARGEGFGFGIARREEKVLEFGFWLRGAMRIALLLYKGALLSVLHVSSSRNN